MRIADGVLHIVGLVALAVIAAGCTGSISESKRQAIAEAYCETLLARNMYHNKPAIVQHAVDSIAQAYGFDNEQELEERILRLTEDPDNLRRMLDSAQHRLERAQNGTDIHPQQPVKK